METYFLIQTISTATKINENFAGEVHLYIHGKGDELLMMDTPDGHCNKNLLTPYFVRQYGYKRECDAKRNYSLNHPENSKFWKSETRIITAWVRKDGKVLIS